ncbi:MAG: XrtA/PEP-CTERM system TPR-repeat protein PrsT [Desulfuromonadales bacterium]
MKPFWTWFLLLLVVIAFGCREQSKEDVFQQGMEFVNAGNYQAAVTLFKEALDKDPNFVDARMQLGIAYLETGKVDQAENELAKALRQDPDNNLLTLRLAEIYLKTKRPDQATELLDRLQNSDPDNPEALRLNAEIKAQSGDLRAAEDLLRKSLSIRSNSSPTQLGLAQVLYLTGRADEADELIDAVIAKHPDNSAAYYLLLRKALSQGDRDNAIAALKKIKTISPEEYYAPYLLGMLYLDTGQIAEARQIADEINTRAPGHPVANRIDGVALYLVGDFAAAAEKLQESLTGMPDLPGFYFLGLANYRTDQLEQAISNFQKALDKAPTHQQARLMIAQTFLKQGRIDDCIQQAKLVIQQNANNANAHNILGSAYLLQKNYDLAMTEIEAAIEIDPDLAQAHLKKGLFNLAAGKNRQGEVDLANAVNAAPEILNTRLLLVTYYLRQHNYPMALQVLEEGLAITSDSALIYNMMAAAYFGQNKADAAVQSLQKAKKLKPEYLTPYFNLANYHASRKDYPAALQEYQDVLQVAPDSLQALLKSAALYELTGQNDQAALFYDKAVKTQSPAGYLALAAYQLRNGRKDAGLQTLKEGYHAHPDNQDLIITYAEVLRRAGQFDDALLVYIHLEELRPGAGKPLLLSTHLQKEDFAAAREIADQAIAENPAASQGYLFQAAIHERRSEWKQAETIILQGIAATDGDLTLRINLARLYSRRGASEEAQKIYDGILREKPDLVPVLFSKAAIFDQAGDKKQAQSLYEKILAIDENHVPALNNLAMLLLDVYADHKRAMDLAVKGFRFKPENPIIIDTLGYALLKNGEVEKSIVFLEKAANLMPGEVTIKLHLAQAYKEAGRRDDAVATLAVINESNSAAEQYKAAKDLLNQLN